MLNRKYELIFGQPVTFSEGIFQAPSSPLLNSKFSLADQILNIEGKSVILTGHHLDFTIKRNSKGDLGSATITVYNPSQDTLNYVRTFSKQDIAVVLSAGYDDNFGTMFIGTVSSSSHISNGVDQVLRLTCKDGEVQTKEAYTSRTYRKGTPIQQVFDGLLSDMNLPVGALVIPEENNTPIKKNIVIAGKTAEKLKQLAEDVAADVFISNGVLEVLPKYEVTSSGATIVSTSSSIIDTAFTLSPSTGMVGSPVPLETGTDNKQGSSTNIYRLTVKSLLLPTVRIGDLVTIESEFNNNGRNTSSVFKVISIQHTGNYEGQDWTTTLDVESITGYKVVT